MATTSFQPPDETLPDIGIYPVGGRHTMPSFAHERARLIIVQILISLLTPRSLVAEELAVMWDRADLRDHLLPDIMVALDAGEYDPVYGVLRNQYRIWHEGKPPELVIELASKTTVGRDRLGKKEDYARLNVPEYVQFDPLEEYLQPSLQVFRLRQGQYEQVPAAPDGGIASQVLEGYAWVRTGIYLRLRDRSTGILLPTPEEARQREAARAAAEAARADAEAARADAEAALRLQVDAEVARLRAENARLRAGSPPVE